MWLAGGEWVGALRACWSKNGSSVMMMMKLGWPALCSAVVLSAQCCPGLKLEFPGMQLGKAGQRSSRESLSNGPRSAPRRCLMT